MSLTESLPRPLSGSDGISTYVNQGSGSSNQTHNYLLPEGQEDRIAQFLGDKESFQIIPVLSERNRISGIRNQIDDIDKHHLGTSPTIILSPPAPSISPTTAENARTYRELVADPNEFAHHWENLAPDLIKSISEHSDVSTVNVFQTALRDKKELIFLSRSSLTSSRKNALRDIILRGLPRSFQSTLDFHFAIGTVVAAQEEQHDYFCKAKNPSWHRKPMMGDSVGIECDHCDEYERGSGTLGLLLEVDGLGYWVVNNHLLPEPIKDPSGHEIKLHQPSIPDYDDQYGENPNPGFNELGTFALSSGELFKTARKSLDPFKFADGVPRSHYVVTDWAAFRAQRVQDNQMRIMDKEDADDNYIRSGSVVIPGQKVRVSGRTSGLTEAFISLVPSIVYGHNKNVKSRDDGNFLVVRGNGTGVPTREWTICHDTADTETKYEGQAYNDFKESGAGIPGDSGAPVVDVKSKEYYGMVWGRNEYSVNYIVDENDSVKGIVHIPRISYFTTYHDLCDDIHEKMGSKTRPKLPNILERRRPSVIGLPRRSSAFTGSRSKRSMSESIRKMLAATTSPASNVPHVPVSLPISVI